MFERGKIILVPFPFTDLTSVKIRPAVILSKQEKRAPDVIICFITSKQKEKHSVSVLKKDAKKSGLKVDSWIRCDKIATLDKKIVLGELGALSKIHLAHVEKNIKITLGLT